MPPAANVSSRTHGIVISDGPMSQVKPPGGGQAEMPSMGPLSGILGGTFAVISVVVYAPYPSLMLLFFTRDRVRASMTR